MTQLIDSSLPTTATFKKANSFKNEFEIYSAKVKKGKSRKYVVIHKKFKKFKYFK